MIQLVVKLKFEEKQKQMFFCYLHLHQYLKSSGKRQCGGTTLRESESGRGKRVLLSLFTVCLSSWGEEEEEDGVKVGGWGGGQPAILPVSVFLLASTVAPLVATPPPTHTHTAWPRAPVGGRGGEPHRKQEIMWERARGSRGGERRRQPWCATAAAVTRREWENGKLGWLHPAGSVSQLPPRKQRRKFCHIVGTSLLSSPCQHTHPHCHCYCHCSPARASSLPLLPSDKKRSNAPQPPLW